MIPHLPDPRPAIRELERTLQERREHNAKRPVAGGIMRIEAMATALWYLKLCERMTYYEEN